MDPQRLDKARRWRRAWREWLALLALLCGVGAMIASGNGAAWQDEGQDAEPPLREAILTLVDQSRVTGLLVEDGAEEIVLRINGIDTPFARSRVARVELLEPVVIRYRRMRDATADSDFPRLLDLAQWLFDREQYGLALKQVQEVLNAESGNPRAQKMERHFLAQIELVARAGQRPERKADGPEEDEPVRVRREEFPRLSPEDINLIKVYEVDLDDPPRLLIKRETITKLIERYATSSLIPASNEGRELLYRRRPIEILDLMFRLQARELYHEVQVRDQPAAIRVFRDRVHRTWLMNSCATTRCHGGADAGRFRLDNGAPAADETVYTNLLILERYRLEDGRALIDYTNPTNSPLLQMALPAREGLTSHPQVSGRYRPIFRREDDRRFKQAVDWIRGMYQPRPNYPIDYTPAAPFEVSGPDQEGDATPR